MVTLNAVKAKTEKISAESFATMSTKERSEISIVRIIPPSLNGSDFGKLEIKTRNSSYEVKL